MKAKRLWRQWFPNISKPELGKVSSDFRHELIARLNFEREKQAYFNWLSGSDFFYVPLNRDERLERAAQLHADYMGRYELLTPGHRTYNTHSRIIQSGYPCYRRFVDCSENISNFDGSPHGLTYLWMDSEVDRNNILNNDWVDVGIGMAKARSGLKYWCAKFARPHVFEEIEFTEEELFELLSYVWPHGLHPEDLMRLNLLRKKKPRVENLEGRQMLASNVLSTLAGGTLAIVGTNQADSIRISNPTATTVQLDIKGQASQSWPSTAVNKVVINGLNGDDSIINLTQIPSNISEGNGNNYINTGDPSKLGTGANDTIRVGNGNNVIQDSGGSDVLAAGNGNNVIFAYGKDNIVAGNGNNVLYNIVGSGNIVAGNGQNRVITNANFSVSVGKNSYPTLIFTARPNPVTLNANGTLNFAATTGNTLVTIDDNYDGTITTNYVNDATGVSETDIFPKAAVTEIGAIFGKGTGTFINNTDIDNVVYGGGAGGNTLIGGSGFNFMKSNAIGDVIDGSAGSSNVLSEGGGNASGADVIIGGTAKDIIIGGFQQNTTVLSTGTNDVVIGDIAAASILAAQKTKLYN